MLIETEDYYSVTNFAKRRGYTKQSIYKFIRYGLVKFIMIDDKPFIHKNANINYIERNSLYFKGKKHFKYQSTKVNGKKDTT